MYVPYICFEYIHSVYYIKIFYIYRHKTNGDLFIMSQNHTTNKGTPIRCRPYSNLYSFPSTYIIFANTQCPFLNYSFLFNKEHYKATFWCPHWKMTASKNQFHHHHSPDTQQRCLLETVSCTCIFSEISCVTTKCMYNPPGFSHTHIHIHTYHTYYSATFHMTMHLF